MATSSTALHRPCRPVLLITAFALSVGGAAHAQDASATPGEGSGGEGELLIWSNARSEDVAEGQLATLKQAVAPLNQFVEVHGTVVDAARYGTLKKAGPYAVALGICSKAEAAQALRLFQALSPEVYARPVRRSSSNDDLPCPARLASDSSGEGAPWQLLSPSRVTSGKVTFVGLPFSHPSGAKTSLAASNAGLRVIFLLFDARKHSLLSSAEYRPLSDAVELKSFTSASHGFDLQVRYADPPCDEHSDRFVEWRGSTTASIAGDSIHLQESQITRLKEGRCGVQTDAVTLPEPTQAQARAAPAPAAVESEPLVPLPFEPEPGHHARTTAHR